MTNPDLDAVFVGTGAIGLPMAARLASAGFRISAVEASPERREFVAQAGRFAVVGALADAPRANAVVVMVATGEQLAAIVETALAVGVDGQTWVIMSTVGVDAVSAAATALTRAGAEVVDAPVTGGVAGAEAGTLRIFVSGAEAPVARAWPLLEGVGRPVVVGDEVGAGQAFKVVNQHLCSVHLVAAAEALELASAMGLDQQLVLDLVGSGAGASWMLGDRGPRMVTPGDTVTSTIDIFVKDSGLVSAAARKVGFSASVLEAARARLLSASGAGQGRMDDSTINLDYRR